MAAINNSISKTLASTTFEIQCDSLISECLEKRTGAECRTTNLTHEKDQFISNILGVVADLVFP